VTAVDLSSWRDAFLEAGAPAVIGSLWPLRDDDARWLIRAFYRHAQAGETFAAALQGMRRDAVSAGLPAHAWSALVVLGNGDLRLAPAAERPNGQRALWIVSALALGLAALVWHARRFRASRD